MNVSDTKPLNKSCSKCGIIKCESMFIPKRNICKECRNTRSREKYKSLSTNNLEEFCNNCNQNKEMSMFVKNRKICKDCNNLKRRTRYENDEVHRDKIIKNSTEFKKKIDCERNKLKEEEIGIDNKKCKYCHKIKHNTCFRKNRLKCKDCERDEPLDKLKRIIRSRISNSLAKKHKHTVEYLGCSIPEYIEWLLDNNSNYDLDNRGSVWHIDHVIPLSTFDLNNNDEQMIAFNWRNTMPLSCRENLRKNNKIIIPQIEEHFKKLIDYHKENNIYLPQNYIDLFAKHLDAGSPLEPS